jgi:hypothetical protein
MAGCRREPSVEAMNTSSGSSSAVATRSRFGLPLAALAALALLAVPRVVLHDLGIVTEDQLVNLLLVFVPLVVWIGGVLAARVPNPFLTLTVIGLCYGVLLAGVHQLLWMQAFADVQPRLGGNLSHLDPAVQTLLMRTAAVISSLFTGTIVGAGCGVVAWVISTVSGRFGVGARR